MVSKHIMQDFVKL